MKNNPVEKLFPEEVVTGSPEAIVEALGRYGVRSLAYDGSIGSNPGYMFRGEAAFDYPLQTSLERGVRKKLSDTDSLNSETLREEECRKITCFANGSGGRFASIFYPHGKGSRQHPNRDVFWILSLMQHYGLPTRLLDFTLDIRMALHFAIEQQSKTPTQDIIIYCFPCKGLKRDYDDDTNKCPFRHNGSVLDMNVAVGCQIELESMGKDQPTFASYQTRKRPEQAWGWDRPRYQNPRLEAQRGMFVYPYDYPGKNGLPPLAKNGPSWFVQALMRNAADPFNVGSAANSVPPKRLRIAGQNAKPLQTLLKEQFEICKDTVYERYSLLNARSFRKRASRNTSARST